MMRGDLTEYGNLRNIPSGAYALGFSGGADSTALLLLLREHRPDIALHIVHLNHQTRGEESDREEKFVAGLAERWDLLCTIARRSEIEPQLETPPKNKSALFRAMRFRLFADAVRAHRLAGVLLAHHADDQSETVLHRLLRGSGVRGLRGMAFQSTQRVHGERLIIYRPLLAIERAELRGVLQEHSQNWCEDSSNRSEQYLRNRLRRILREDAELSHALRELGCASRTMAAWVSRNTPNLDASFRSAELWDLPPMLAESAARRYLRLRGCPAEELTPIVVRRLIEMVNDAATPSRQMFPGNVTLRRRGGLIGPG
jgi:tRNA(Ile)-lysidine synthetase-like protein